MSTVVIVGTDSVAGYHLACEWSGRHRVCGVEVAHPVDVPGVACGSVKADRQQIMQTLSDLKATHVVFAGACDKSSWDAPELSDLRRDAELATLWAEAAAELGLQLTLLSSDGVFSGPWLFHAEDSQSWCESDEAQAIRQMEQAVLEIDPHALVIRANAFAWGPTGGGWVSRLYEELEQGGASFDCIAHAAPVLVNHLAELIEACWDQNLEGVWHAGSAERTNRLSVARSLACQLGLVPPAAEDRQMLSCCPTEFGRGESTLHSRRLARALGRALPALEDGLQQVAEQVSRMSAPAFELGRVA